MNEHSGAVAKKLEKLTGAPLEAYARPPHAYIFSDILVSGFLSKLMDYNTASATVLANQLFFSDLGYQVFVTNIEIKKGKQHGQIAAIQSTDKYDMLRAQGTNGASYAVDTQSIIQKLQTWDELYGIIIFGADKDCCDIEFLELPIDVLPLAHEIYHFCPDSVERGAGSITTLEAAIEAMHGLFLWWK